MAKSATVVKSAAKSAPVAKAIAKAVAKAVHTEVCISKTFFKSIANSFVKAVASQDATIQKAVDAYRAKGLTVADIAGKNSRTSPERKTIETFFASLAEAGHISTSSARVYASNFWMAFESGAPFSRRAHITKSAEKTASRAPQQPKGENVGEGKKAEDATKTKASLVVTANADNLQSLVLQTIKMARDLGKTNCAVKLVAVAKEYKLIPASFQ
jgi:hypothetical protein